MNFPHELKNYARRSDPAAMAWLCVGIVTTAALSVWLLIFRPDSSHIPYGLFGVALVLVSPTLALLGVNIGRQLSMVTAGSALPLFAIGMAADGMRSLQVVGCVVCALQVYIYGINRAVRRHCSPHEDILFFPRGGRR